MENDKRVVVAHNTPAESDRICAAVQEHGYEPMVCSAAEAHSALMAPEGPRIAILDEALEGPSTMDICTEAHSGVLDVHPYVAICTKSTKEALPFLDVAESLLLVEPWAVEQIFATLTVASRIVQLQVDINEHVQELEKVLRRHNLLAEIASRRNVKKENAGGGTEAAAAEAPKPAVKEAPGLSQDLTSLETIQAMPGLLTDTLMMLGFTAEPVDLVEPGELTSWCALYVKKLDYWLEFAVSVSSDAASSLVEAMLGMPPSNETELSDGFSELLNIMQGSVKSSLEAEGYEVLYPYLPCVSSSESLYLERKSPHSRWSFDVFGQIVTISVYEEHARTRKVNYEGLEVGQVTTETLTSSDNPDVVLLKEASVLTQRYVDQLTRVGKRDIKLQIPVAAGTPLATHSVEEPVAG